MTVFYSLASVLTLFVLVWLLRPLLRHHKPSQVSSQQLNVAIYREQLEALDADLARSAITPQEHEGSRDELQLRMLDDAQDAPSTATTSRKSAYFTAVVVALLVVLGSAGMYRWLGSPQAIDPVSADKAERDKVFQMVDDLAKRLKANPDNPRGWAMLARSYKVMGRLDEAMQAYSQTGTLLETEPDLMADYADLLAVRAGDNLTGAPMELVRKALAINPKHPMSLMLAAAQSYRESNFKQAIAYWETLLTVVDPQSPDAEQVMGYIAEAREKAGLPAGKTKAPAPAQAPTQAGANAAPAGQPDNAQILQMVERLATRLQSNPDDLEGWARLARSYKVLGRLDDAEKAYEKASALVNKTPDMLTDLADLLATRAGGSLEGRPLKLVNQALALQPTHPMALMLSGMAAYRRGEFAVAIAQWEKLAAVLEPGSPNAQWLAARIGEAKAKLK
ncbi:MAG: c-type cytochrome biogenesis protein CcmI [Rhodoferax sp.]|nr:c-type cytochrome biogenesis protein CcmI [Rhodoferax sp.]